MCGSSHMKILKPVKSVSTTGRNKALLGLGEGGGGSLTDAGVAAAARFGTSDTSEEDLQLRVEQSHIFTSEDLGHTTNL